MLETLKFSHYLSDCFNQYKSISILVAYFVTIGWLLYRCISVILAHLRHSGKKRFEHDFSYRGSIFVCLAVLSLVSTWYFMVSFLIQSYRDWIVEHPGPALSFMSNVQSWLDETYLFEQAWSAIVETEPRFWWTIQIFGFASIWSIFLGIEGQRNKIKDIWIFMLLGQLVAISFAANLSFLVVLLARRQPKRFYGAAEKSKHRFGFGSHLAVIISFACAALTSTSHGDKAFVVVLLMPHLMAFAPMTPWLKPDPSVYYTVALLETLLFAHTTWKAMANGCAISDFAVALYEYPAVSSAGWDVICCWISFTVWILVD